MALSSNDTNSPVHGHGNEGNGFERHDRGFMVGIIVCLSVASLVGFVGNGLVVAVILRAKKLKSVMNRFILHLAISDMIVSVLAIPLFLFINFNNGLTNDTTSLIVCKLARFFQYLSPEASMTLLITIGWNRYQAVVHPLNIMTYGSANKLILAAWLFAILVVSPSLYLTHLGPESLDAVTNQSLTYCTTIPATTVSGLIYVMFLSLVGYLLPLTSLIILYGKIYKTVWRRKSAQLGESRPIEAFIRSRKKVLKMFLTVIFVFLLTWVPLLLYVSAIEWTVNSTSRRNDYARLITYSLGLCNSICNPFIYALFNAKFRAGCKEMVNCSFKAFWRRGSSTDANSVNVGVTRGPKQAVLSRRGGFHGTKGDDKKNSEKKTDVAQKATKAQESANKITAGNFGQRIASRLRPLKDIEATTANSTDAVQLVRFQRDGETTLEAGDIVLHFPRSKTSQFGMDSFTSNRENFVKFDNCVFDESGESDGNSESPEQGQIAEPSGHFEEDIKIGYKSLKGDHSSPLKARRTRSEGFIKDLHRSPRSYGRIQSTPGKT